MEDTYGIQSRIGSIIVVERWYCCRGSPVFSDRNIQHVFCKKKGGVAAWQHLTYLTSHFQGKHKTFFE